MPGGIGGGGIGTDDPASAPGAATNPAVGGDEQRDGGGGAWARDCGGSGGDGTRDGTLRMLRFVVAACGGCRSRMCTSSCTAEAAPATDVEIGDGTPRGGIPCGGAGGNGAG